MQCQAITEVLDDYLIGGGDAALRREVAAHCDNCSACQRRVQQMQRLQQDLRALPIPAPSQDFAERVLLAACQQPVAMPAHKPRSWQWLSMALAASLVAAVGLGLWLGQRLNQYPSLEEVQLALHQTQTVQLVLESETDLNDVLLSLQLPQGVEVQGFAGQRRLAWRTQLQQGSNLLALPLTATGLVQGKLVARIEHESKSKELTVNLRVQANSGRRQGEQPLLVGSWG